VKLWITLTLTEANLAKVKVSDLFCDSILSQFSRQASNRNLGLRPIIKELIVLRNVNGLLSVT
jgi:hypothetical protein